MHIRSKYIRPIQNNDLLEYNLSYINESNVSISGIFIIDNYFRNIIEYYELIVEINGECKARDKRFTQFQNILNQLIPSSKKFMLNFFFSDQNQLLKLDNKYCHFDCKLIIKLKNNCQIDKSEIICNYVYNNIDKEHKNYKIQLPLIGKFHGNNYNECEFDLDFLVGPIEYLILKVDLLNDVEFNKLKFLIKINNEFIINSEKRDIKYYNLCLPYLHNLSIPSDKNILYIPLNLTNEKYWKSNVKLILKGCPINMVYVIGIQYNEFIESEMSYRIQE